MLAQMDADLLCADSKGNIPGKYTPFHTLLYYTVLYYTMLLEVIIIFVYCICPAHLSASEGHLECLRLLVYYKHTPSLILNARNNKVCGSTELM